MESTVSVKKEAPDANLSGKRNDRTDSSSCSNINSVVNSLDTSDLNKSSPLFNSGTEKIYNQWKLFKRKRNWNVGEESSGTKKPKLEQSRPPGLCFPSSPLGLVLDVEPISERFQENFENNKDHGGNINQTAQVTRSCKQFWKAGDYEGVNDGNSALCSGKF